MLPHQHFPEHNTNWIYDEGFDLYGHVVYDTDANGNILTYPGGDRKVKLSVSKWAFSKEDLQFVNQFGYIYLSVVGGQPPVSLFAEPLFNEVVFVPNKEPEAPAAAAVKPMKSTFKIIGHGKDCCMADMLGLDDEQEQEMADMVEYTMKHTRTKEQLINVIIENCETDNEIAYCLMLVGTYLKDDDEDDNSHE
jgi:hypothetical protein